MSKTLSFTLTVEVNIDPLPEVVVGLRSPFGSGSGFDFRTELDVFGCLDAPMRSPAGSCYKREWSSLCHSVYDSSTFPRGW